MKRVLTGLALIPIFTYIVLWAPQWLFLGVLIAVALMSYYEYAGLVAAHGIERPGPPAYAIGLVLMLAPSDVLIATVLGLFALTLSLRVRNLAGALPYAAAMMLGVLYIFGSWRAAGALRAIDPLWLLLALAINWVGDTAAYYTGRAIGSHRLAPAISPGKTWEGTIGSLVASVIFGFVFIRFLLPDVAILQAVLLPAAGNAAGQLGDLAESAMKRGGGLKDSGNLLPGHGGWLDRVDSTLFSVPVIYFLLTQFASR